MIFLALLFVLNTANAQDSTAARGFLSVDSPVGGVSVYCDTTLLGVVPVREAPVPAGTRVLRYVHPQGDRWLYPAVVETLVIAEGEHCSRSARFSNICHVTSDPYGAEIRLRDSLIGTTPLFVALDAEGGMITITRAGYAPATLPVARELHAILTPLPGGAGQGLYLSAEQSRSFAPVAAAAGVTVVSGAVAAYFKIRADRAYDDYRRTGDDAALDDVRRDDLVSGIALAASQASLLLLGYLLFSR